MLLATIMLVAAAAAPIASPAEVCVIDDPRAVELSGLVATADGYVTVVDSQFDPDTILVIFLDQGCQVTRTVAYPTPARDPEDIAVAPDGGLWVADIGDNGAQRSTVALWQLPADGSPPVIHRLTYPDGARDAEALFFDSTGQPVIVTKALGSARLYRPEVPLQPRTAEGVPMRLVGEFTPPSDLGFLGSFVTGAAVSPDRTRVALRTYTVAFEWDIAAGADMVTTITTVVPRQTPLDDPQGEAIAYTLDGAAFLTVSDEAGPTSLRRYEPASRPTPAAADVAEPKPLPGVGGGRWPVLAAAGAGTVALGAFLVTLYRLLRRRGA